MKASKAYPKSIQEILNRLKDQEKKALSLIADAHLVETVAADMPELSPKVSAGVLFGNKYIKITIRPSSMKEVANFLRVFSKRNKRIDKIDVNPELGSIDYTLKNSNIRIEAFFDQQTEHQGQSDKKCKFIKIGEKREIKEVVTPIYELQCDS